MHISSLVRAALAACVIAVPAASTAAAATVPADLRVEAVGDTDLSHGWTYFSDTAKITSDKSEACGGKGESHTLEGATALGLLDFARAHNDRLDPLRVSDEFDFGLLVCGIGSFVADESESKFWTYKVNHVAPEVGADQYSLKPGDEVLWVYANYATGANSGNELELAAPGTVEPGESFEVKVSQYDFAGTKSPAAGARVQVLGGEEVVTDEEGKAQVTLDGKRKSPVLRAYRGTDIPSRGVRVCVDRCQKVYKERFFGTRQRDVIEAKGNFAELVKAGAGRDKIDVSGDSFSDRVICGGGRDTVVADAADRIARNCEKVRTK